MIFNLRKSRIYHAIRFPALLVKILFWISLLIAAVLLAAVLFPDFHIFPLTFTKDEITGWFFIFLFIASIASMFTIFYVTYLTKPKGEQDLTFAEDAIKTGQFINLADYLTFDAALAIYQALAFVRRKSINLSFNSIFLFLIQNKRAQFIFNRLLINYEQFQKSLEVIVDSQKKVVGGGFKKDDLDMVLVNALKIAQKREDKKITFGSVFAAVMEADKTLENLFFDYGAKKEDVISVALWEENFNQEYFLKEPVRKSLLRVHGFADDWSYGYTPVLNKYSEEIMAYQKPGQHIHPIGRDKEILKIEEILSSSGKKNVILIGDAGVGRENVILGLARNIRNGRTLPGLKHKRLKKLNLNTVLGKTKDEAATIDLLNKIFSECMHAGNVILVIDDMHNFIGRQDEKGKGRVDISGIITPYMQSDKFQILATTDYGHYHQNIESSPSVSILMEQVNLSEPDEEATLMILEDLTPSIEIQNRVFISYHALLAAVSDSGSYIQNIPYPEKAISLLTEVVSYVLAHKAYGNIILQDHVTEVISQKTGIQLGRIEGDEKSKLLNFENLLHERIIGQEQAISVISEAMRRLRSGISERSKPIGTFLFLGPTGVGKTETSKALASVYFGSEERMIRLDMTEYQSEESISRLIGSVDTNAEAQFANKVRENPFSLVLLDEFEKAHPNIANLLLQVLDEGRLTDAYQKKVSFRNTIIIATSNAGAEFIREYVLSGQNQDVLGEKLKEHLLKEKLFKPEFLNRFDAVVVFKPLQREEIKQIAKLLLLGLAKRLDQKGMKLQVTDDILERLADIGYSPSFGAREMKRTIQEKLENRIAKEIIEEKYKYGSEIIIDPKSL